MFIYFWHCKYCTFETFDFDRSLNQVSLIWTSAGPQRIHPALHTARCRSRTSKSTEIRWNPQRCREAHRRCVGGNFWQGKKGLVWLIWHLATICYMSLRFKQKGTMLCIVTALLCRPFFWLWDDWSFCIFCKGFHRTAIACHSNDWFGKFLDDIWWLRSANPRALCVSLLSRLGKETRPKIFEERTDGWIWSFSACHLFLMFTIGSFTSSKVSRLSMKLTECLGHTTGQATISGTKVRCVA